MLQTQHGLTLGNFGLVFLLRKLVWTGDDIYLWGLHEHC